MAHKQPRKDQSLFVIDKTPSAGNVVDDESIEKALEDAVFGPSSTPFARKDEGTSSSHDSAESDSDAEWEEEEKEERKEVQAKLRRVKSSGSWRKRKPVWEDEDDLEVTVDLAADKRLRKLRSSTTESTVTGDVYSRKLRRQFQKLSGDPEWAQRGAGASKSRTSDSEDESASGEEGEEDTLLQTAGSVLGRSSKLPKGTVDIKRMKNANRAKPAQAVIQSLHFHPHANVLLTAGFHKSLDFFQVNGDTNPKLQSIHVEHFPVLTARFTPDGREVIASGIRRGFFVYDMYSGKVAKIHGIKGHNEKAFDRFAVTPDNEHVVFLGKDGYMIFLSGRSKQWVCDLKMNGSVKDIAFTADSRQMYSVGSDGEVYVWDLSSRRCVHKFTDEGCVLGTKVAVSPDGQRVACGSASGVVNVYDDSCLRESRPKPLRSVLSLTTGVDNMCFNHTGEVLAVSSAKKKNALKLVHVQSLSVFSNWPSIKTSLRYVSAMDFSPTSCYLAVGNDGGKALLYRLNHFL